MGHTPNPTVDTSPYTSLTARMALNLAAPHTWPAAVLPCLVAMAAGSIVGPVHLSTAFVLLAICVLMQASVNTFNDYYDYAKGADSVDDNLEADDNVLAYNAVNPAHVKLLAVGFLAAAFILGAYIIWLSGWVPLAIGIVGAFFVVAYSAGKTPLSYLPVGEFVSGIVMGGLIPLACYYVVTGHLEPLMALWALPTVIGVGLIMMTNNTCDIEKDIPAGRRTLPVRLGRARARAAYHGAVVIWIACIVLNVVAFYTGGALVLPFMLLAVYPQAKALFSNPLAPQSRIAAMGQIAGVNITLGAFYAAAIFAGTLPFCW